MSEAWMDGWNHGAALWAAAMARACWQGSVGFALVWVAGRVFPRLPPAARCWLWRLAFLKLLAALLWARPIDLPVWHRAAAERWFDQVPLLKPVLLPAGDPALAASRTAAPPISLPELLALLWLIGVGV